MIALEQLQLNEHFLCGDIVCHWQLKKVTHHFSLLFFLDESMQM